MMRHAIANLLYRLGRAIDRPVQRFNGYTDDIGDETLFNERPDETHASMSVHMRRDVPIGGSFRSDANTYASLDIGRGKTIHLFLERESTLRMLGVLEEIERRYKRYGERGWHS